MAGEGTNNNSAGYKRKLDEEEAEHASSSDDEDGLFIPQAREVLAQSKKINSEKEIHDCSSEEDNSDEWITDEEVNSGISSPESSDEDKVIKSEEDVLEEEDERKTGVLNDGETIEDLAAGREEKEDDDVILAIQKAAEPVEKTKPPDIIWPIMITDLSFHPKDNLIALADIEGEIRCYRYGIEENELLHTLNHHKKACRVVTFDDAGTTLFSASKDKSVVMIDTATMSVVQAIPKAHNAPIYSMLCIDPNVWASGDDDGAVKVWDRRRAALKPVVEFKEMDEFVSCMVTDASNRLLVCTSGEGTLTAFNTRGKKMEGQSEVYPSEMNCLGLVRQGTKVLTGLGNGNMYIFDWNAFGYHSDAFGDHPSGVNCMIPIAENVVISGCDDGKIRALSVFPHRFLGVVGYHKFPIERLDISTCGSYIASSSHDGRVRFWNISYFDKSDETYAASTTKKSVRNKKRSLRKERLGFQLPSSRKKNRGDFFSGLAEPKPECSTKAADEPSSDDSEDDSDE